MRKCVLVIAAAAVPLLSACGSHGATTSAVTPSSASPSAGTSSSRSPMAASTRRRRRQEALAKGFTNKEIDHWYGADGKYPLTIVLNNGTYQVRGVGDDGVERGRRPGHLHRDRRSCGS